VNRGEELPDFRCCREYTVVLARNQAGSVILTLSVARCAHPSAVRAQEIRTPACLQIVAPFVGDVEGMGTTRRQLVETASNAVCPSWSRNLNQTGEAALSASGECPGAPPLCCTPALPELAESGGAKR